MNQLKNEINLDRAVGAVENASTGEEKMSNSSKKTPWHLRFAPGVLRPIGRLAFKTVSLASAIIQPIRRRLNQWNWRQKTALVTALAITATGVFYQQRANAAALLGPILAAKPADFLVKFFIGYAIGKSLNSAFSAKLQKTANADTEHCLYDHRELHFTFKENGDWRWDGENYTRTIHATATADEGPSHDTSGTDSYLLELGYNSDALTKSEVLYQEVTDNANLSGASITYDVEELVDGVWETLEYDYDSRTGSPADYFLYVTYGGYIPEPTDAELQKDLDDFRSEWNAMAATNNWMYPSEMGPLRVGVEIRSTKETIVCNKAVKLWSEFSFNRVPGDTTDGPDELETPGDRPYYVTRLSYTAYEAGYSGGIVIRNKREITEYPEPKSYENDYFKPFDLAEIPWDNFQITVDPVWTGTATRYFKDRSKKRWCKFCERSHRRALRSLPGYPSPCTPGFSNTTRYEFKVFQNESVVKP